MIYGSKPLIDRKTSWFGRQSFVQSFDLHPERMPRRFVFRLAGKLFRAIRTLVKIHRSIHRWTVSVVHRIPATTESRVRLICQSPTSYLFYYRSSRKRRFAGVPRGFLDLPNSDNGRRLPVDLLWVPREAYGLIHCVVQS